MLKASLSRPPRSSARFLTVAPVLAAALALFLTGCGEEKAKEAAPVLPKVVVMEAHTTKVPLEYTFNGILSAKETVEVRARVSGYVAERLFDEGSQVTAGKVLYKLDDRDLSAALDTAKANTAKAKAAWEEEDTTRNRMVTLAEKEAVSLQMRDSAVAKADEALAAYQAAQADEEKAAINLGYATIVAPTDGYVSRSNVEVGSYVDAGNATLLATVYKIDPIRAEFSVTDTDYARFKKTIMDQGGRPENLVFLLLLGDDRVPYPRTGVLEMADPVIDSKTNTLGVRAEFPNPDHMLRPGMYVNVVARTGERDVLVVPEVALVDQGTSKIVYSVDDQSALVAVPVAVGNLVGEERIITSGLKPGQKVVVEGLVTARPGLKVEMVTKQPAPAASAAPAEEKAAPAEAGAAPAEQTVE